MKIPISKTLLDEVLSVLVHNRGDGRICPVCHNTVIHKDRTALESFEAYKKLKKEMEENA